MVVSEGHARSGGPEVTAAEIHEARAVASAVKVDEIAGTAAVSVASATPSTAMNAMIYARNATK